MLPPVQAAEIESMARHFGLAVLMDDADKAVGFLTDVARKNLTKQKGLARFQPKNWDWETVVREHGSESQAVAIWIGEIHVDLVVNDELEERLEELLWQDEFKRQFPTFSPNAINCAAQVFAINPVLYDVDPFLHLLFTSDQGKPMIAHVESN